MADGGQVNSSKGTRSVLLTNYHLRVLAGSELVTLDLAKLFRTWHWEVAVAAFDVGQPVQGLFGEMGIGVVHLDDPSLQRGFDLLWAHHWPTIATVLGSGRTSARRVVFSSLGPSEPLETPPPGGGVDVYLAVSEETRALMATLGIQEEDILLFPNSVSSAWIESGVAQHGRLQSIAFVSNHLPDEVRDAMAALSRTGIGTTHIGLGGVPEYVTPSLISRFDAVVSIGRTIVQSLAAGVPAFCYDLFGGAGWVMPENVETMARYNFSGRDSLSHLSADGLADRIMAGWDGAVAHVRQLHEWVARTRSLEKNVTEVLALLDSRPERRAMPSSADWAVVSRYARCVLRADQDRAALTGQLTAMQATRGWKLLEMVRRWRRALGWHPERRS